MNKSSIMALVGLMLLVFGLGAAQPLWADSEHPTERELAVRRLLTGKFSEAARQPLKKRVQVIDAMIHPGACADMRRYYRDFARQLKQPFEVRAIELPYDRRLPTVHVFSIVVSGPGRYYRLNYNDHSLPRGGLEIIPYFHDYGGHQRLGHDDDELMRHPRRDYTWND